MELVRTLLVRFAAEYDCGAYGAGTYNNGDPCTGAALAATGDSYIALAVIGVVMIAIAIGLLIRRRKLAQR